MSDCLKNVQGITFWQSPLLNTISFLKHGFSCRRGGVSRGPFASLNMGLKGGDDPEAVRKNRQLLAYAFDLSYEQITMVKQVHGHTVLEVTSALTGEEQPQADALLTASEGVVLGILAADCAAVFFFDPVHRAIGLAHAGWRGTAAGIATELLLQMKSLYATRADDVLVAISPSIGSCCLEIRRDVLDFYKKRGRLEELVWYKREDFLFLDLKETIRRQLIKAGVKAQFIASSSYCTSCRQDLFYSYRRDGVKCGSMMAFMSLSGESG